ncbi:MAG: hypothetical protein K9I47_06000 [Bacteroidales bacterium]|nr:hypothetical protein [Bacteroidales bacterium]
MRKVQVDTSKDKFIISIDKNLIDKDLLFQFVDILRLESLAEKVNFDEDMEKLDEEIKENWWEKNKDKFIPKSNQ